MGADYRITPHNSGGIGRFVLWRTLLRYAKLTARIGLAGIPTGLPHLTACFIFESWAAQLSSHLTVL